VEPGSWNGQAGTKPERSKTQKHGDSCPLFDTANTEIAQNAREWAQRLHNLLKAEKPIDTEIATWQDDTRFEYKLSLERQQGRPMLRIYAGGEIIRHFKIAEMDDTLTTQITDGFAGVSEHADILDWFEKTRQLLYPELHALD
jgi:hypothetical protein